MAEKQSQNIPYKPDALELYTAKNSGVAMPSVKYKQRTDGEGFTVESGQIHRIACCDCGLVHDFVFVSEDARPIGIAAQVNRRATAQKRRHMPPNTKP